VLGKLNLHEFANGGTSAASYYGLVRNPWALDRNPGGSSGGSIRTPASYCGIVGLKPTYGLVSIRGIIPLVLSLDHCGPMTRTVTDAALATLASLTGSVRDVVLPSTSDVTLNGEMYAYQEALYAKMSGRYQIPTRRNLLNGAKASAADYIRGRWALERLRRTIDDSFTDVDVVVLPTRRHTPRTVDAALQREETDVPRNPELENTGQFNAYGIPAISVPCGFTAAGLSVGLMIAGPRFAEGRVPALARTSG